MRFSKVNAAILAGVMTFSFAGSAMADCHLWRDVDRGGDSITLKPGQCVILDRGASKYCNGYQQIQVTREARWNNSISSVVASHGQTLDLYRWGEGNSPETDTPMFSITWNFANLVGKSDKFGDINDNTSAAVCKAPKK